MALGWCRELPLPADPNRSTQIHLGDFALVVNVVIDPLGGLARAYRIGHAVSRQVCRGGINSETASCLSRSSRPPRCVGLLGRL